MWVLSKIIVILFGHLASEPLPLFEESLSLGGKAALPVQKLAMIDMYFNILPCS
jgi:hypothetical protein